MKNKFPKLIVAGLMVSTSITLAEEDKHETHGAHEHGRAKIMLVAEKQQLTLQFESPAMNIVGFEHEAKTEAQQKLVQDAINTFVKPESLFIISGGQCEFSKADINNPFSSGSKHEDLEKHDKHSEHQKYDEHGHEEHGHEEHDGESEHREFLVEYSAKCQASDKIEQIDVKLLNAFSGIEVLDIQYIHANKQGADSLNASKTVLRFE
jgi:hypothetical protein